MGGRERGRGVLRADCQQEVGKPGRNTSGRARGSERGHWKPVAAPFPSQPACALGPSAQGLVGGSGWTRVSINPGNSAHQLPADSITQIKRHFLGSKYLCWWAEPQGEARFQLAGQRLSSQERNRGHCTRWVPKSPQPLHSPVPSTSCPLLPSLLLSPPISLSN